MAKTWLFDVRSLVAEIHDRVCPFVQPHLQAGIDSNGLVQDCAIACLCGPGLKDGTLPTQALQRYGMSPEQARELYGYVYLSLNSMFNDAFGLCRDEFVYSFSPCWPGELRITQMKPLPKRTIQTDPIDDIKGAVEKAMENWDYVPEQIRRMVGL